MIRIDFFVTPLEQVRAAFYELVGETLADLREILLLYVISLLKELDVFH